MWVGLEFEAAHLPPPVRPRFPTARWRFADADARDAYAAYLDWSLEPVVATILLASVLLDASPSQLVERSFTRLLSQQLSYRSLT